MVCTTLMEPGSQGEWTGMRTVDKDDFTVLVSGAGRCRWVSMCSVWPWHSKWLNEQHSESASNFELSVNIPLWKLFGCFRRPQLWATGDCSFITAMHPALIHHVLQSFLVKHQITRGDSPPYSPYWSPCDFWLFPKLKITFEREEISDHQWDSGKYNRAADGDWENLCEVPRCLLWRGLRRHCPIQWGQDPSTGHMRGNHTLMFLSLSFSLPSFLSKNK